MHARNILREMGFVSHARARVSSLFLTVFICNYITIHFYIYFGLLGLHYPKAFCLSAFCCKLNAVLWFTFWFTWFTSLIVKKCSSVYLVYILGVLFILVYLYISITAFVVYAHKRLLYAVD